MTDTYIDIEHKRKRIKHLENEIIELEKQIHKARLDILAQPSRKDDPAITYLKAVQCLEAQHGKNHTHPENLQIHDYLKLPKDDKERDHIINVLLSRGLTIQCDYDVWGWYIVKENHSEKPMSPKEILTEQLEKRKLFLACELFSKTRSGSFIS